MRKTHIITILLAVMFLSLQSCKKDNESVIKGNSAPSSLNTSKAQNIDEYLLNFMKDINTPTRNSESLSLEDAMWHVTACLNFRYCNAGVNRSSVEYDTIVSTINVNNGYVSLGDINRSMQEISSGIADVYNSSMMKNKNLLFIMPEITDDVTRGGATVKTVVAISDRLDIQNYYFNNDNTPLSLFPEGTFFQWDTEAIDVLSYYMNIFRPSTEAMPGRVYFTDISTHSCYYLDYAENRLYKTRISSRARLNHEEMAYYLDSYLGLILEHNPSYGTYEVTYIASDIDPVSGNLPNREEVTYHHTLDITYGKIMYTLDNEPETPMN